MSKTIPPMSAAVHQKLVELAELSLKLSDCLALLGYSKSDVDILILDQVVRDSFDYGRQKGREALSRVLVDEATNNGNVGAARLLLAMQEGSKEEIEIKSRDAWAVDRVRLIGQGFNGKPIEQGPSVRRGFEEQRRLHEEWEAEGFGKPRSGHFAPNGAMVFDGDSK
jgi:hypothetical protein